MGLDRTPTPRAMKAAVEMEVHAACSTTTRAKALDLDAAFPGYDDVVKALRDLMACCEAHPAFTKAANTITRGRMEAGRAALGKAESQS